ncbi:hypothetical protein BESB_009740 [Besnoitia besnoiti]|uniref:FAM13A-like domain-containing protein n=1 Tax=Besnoitia besnoiti TaxID=94643 RepID=A0A2A9MR00_BESBE|nr:hypothetical protein BESB_009740 [Besnoitia besnoiti]PFH38632.1 hypothetical protein BESB_009740 [Besnoitia besnoiti]
MASPLACELPAALGLAAEDPVCGFAAGLSGSSSPGAMAAVAALAAEQHQQQLLHLASDLQGAIRRWCPVAGASSQLEAGGGRLDSAASSAGRWAAQVRKSSFFRGCRVLRIPQKTVALPRHLYREEAAIEEEDGLPVLDLEDAEFFGADRDEELQLHYARAVSATSVRSRSGGTKDWGEWPLMPEDGLLSSGEEPAAPPGSSVEEAASESDGRAPEEGQACWETSESFLLADEAREAPHRADAYTCSRSASGLPPAEDDAEEHAPRGESPRPPAPPQAAEECARDDAAEEKEEAVAAADATRDVSDQRRITSSGSRVSDDPSAPPLSARKEVLVFQTNFRRSASSSPRVISSVEPNGEAEGRFRDEGVSRGAAAEGHEDKRSDDEGDGETGPSSSATLQVPSSPEDPQARLLSDDTPVPSTTHSALFGVDAPSGRVFICMRESLPLTAGAPKEPDGRETAAELAGHAIEDYDQEVEDSPLEAPAGTDRAQRAGPRPESRAERLVEAADEDAEVAQSSAQAETDLWQSAREGDAEETSRERPTEETARRAESEADAARAAIVQSAPDEERDAEDKETFQEPAAADAGEEREGERESPESVDPPCAEPRGPRPAPSPSRESVVTNDFSLRLESADSASVCASLRNAPPGSPCHSSSSVVLEHTLPRDPVEAAASAAAAAAAAAGAVLRACASAEGEASSPSSRCAFQRDQEDLHLFVHAWLSACAARLHDVASEARGSSQRLQLRPREGEGATHALVAFSKRRLKEELRTYDLDFEKRYGRPPRRPEKEPLRPLYSHYQYLRRVLLRLEHQQREQTGREKVEIVLSARSPAAETQSGAAGAAGELRRWPSSQESLASLSSQQAMGGRAGDASSACGHRKAAFSQSATRGAGAAESGPKAPSTLCGAEQVSSGATASKTRLMTSLRRAVSSGASAGRPEARGSASGAARAAQRLSQDTVVTSSQRREGDAAATAKKPTSGVQSVQRAAGSRVNCVSCRTGVKLAGARPESSGLKPAAEAERRAAGREAATRADSQSFGKRVESGYSLGGHDDAERRPRKPEEKTSSQPVGRQGREDGAAGGVAPSSTAESLRLRIKTTCLSDASSAVASPQKTDATEAARNVKPGAGMAAEGKGVAADAGSRVRSVSRGLPSDSRQAENFGEDAQRENEKVASGGLSEDKQRLLRLQQEKRILRTTLLTYQADFIAETGRHVRLYKDIAPIEREYRRYKDVKQEISRLLEKQQTRLAASRSHPVLCQHGASEEDSIPSEVFEQNGQQLCV